MSIYTKICNAISESYKEIKNIEWLKKEMLLPISARIFVILIVLSVVVLFIDTIIQKSIFLLMGIKT